MTARRVIEFLALFIIGDGVMGLLKPRWHSLLWSVGPAGLRDCIEELAEHPGKARLVYGAELALGLWVASRQTPEKEDLF